MKNGKKIYSIYIERDVGGYCIMQSMVDVRRSSTESFYCSFFASLKLFLLIEYVVCLYLLHDDLV